MENKENQTLILSLLFHGLLAWILFHLPNTGLPDSSAPVEVSIVDESRPKTTRGMPLPSVEIPKSEIIHNLQDKAQYLSQQKQRVRQQMTAKNITGLTQNRGHGQTPAQQGSRAMKLSELTPEPIEEHMGGASRQRQEDQQDVDSQPASGGLGMFKAIGESSSGQIIPGVKQGDFTFLNSDQLTYYSFYARLNEAIAYRWVSRVRNYVEMLTPAMQKQLARSPNVTVVDIMLNKKGDYLGAKILRSSGDTNLDQAAIAPFKEAAPFENPPLEMADGNGTIHIVGQFTLMFEGI